MPLAAPPGPLWTADAKEPHPIGGGPRLFHRWQRELPYRNAVAGRNVHNRGWRVLLLRRRDGVELHVDRNCRRRPSASTSACLHGRSACRRSNRREGGTRQRVARAHRRRPERAGIVGISMDGSARQCRFHTDQGGSLVRTAGSAGSGVRCRCTATAQLYRLGVGKHDHQGCAHSGTADGRCGLAVSGGRSFLTLPSASNPPATDLGNLRGRQAEIARDTDPVGYVNAEVVGLSMKGPLV